MPFFLAAILGGLVQIAGTIVGKVLLSLGIGYIVFSGVDLSITFARDFVLSKISTQSAQTVAVASTIQIGTALSILTSALVARLTLSGLTGGTIRRMVQKG